VLEKKRPRPTSVRTPANIEAVHVALTWSPSKSTRRASAELGISRQSLQRILHPNLHLFPYKMTVLHKRTAVILHSRLCLHLPTGTLPADVHHIPHHLTYWIWSTTKLLIIHFSPTCYFLQLSPTSGNLNLQHRQPVFFLESEIS